SLQPGFCPGNRVFGWPPKNAVSKAETGLYILMELSLLIHALSRLAAYPYAVDAVEVVQTHISVVFRAGPFVYKIKKPVQPRFCDFSTLEKRRFYCDEEVRLNRRLVPVVYLAVLP